MPIFDHSQPKVIKVILKKNFKNFMVPFYGWGSTASRLEPLRGGSLLFTTKFPEIPGTHFINLGRMKGWVDLRATQWFWTWNTWIGNPLLTTRPLLHKLHCSINFPEFSSAWKFSFIHPFTLWSGWPQPFLTIPTPIFFNQLLFWYQHVKK